MYTYSQGAHTMEKDGALVSTTGHSGNGAGRDNPNMQNVPDVGPLPRGRYKIGPWVMGLRRGPLSSLGPVTASLTPVPDANGSTSWMCGRFGFFIHGPELSEGCPVQLLSIREAMARSGDDDFEVVE